jgi:hypothetical protein
MKKLFLSLLFPLTTSVAVQAQNTVIIPDTNFLKALIATPNNVDTNKDGKIQTSEAQAVTVLNVGAFFSVYYSPIKDLTGIQAFTNLTDLNCSSNKLTSLDLSKNTALVILNCSYNSLINLDLRSNISLVHLKCYTNQLNSIDISKNVNLQTLDCSNNQLKTLYINKNTVLTNLLCLNNKLTVLDLSQNPDLTYLWCNQNQIQTLDVSNNVPLIFFECQNNQLTTLDVRKNLALAHLACDSNYLGELNVRKNINLVSTTPEYKIYGITISDGFPGLSCANNPLTQICINTSQMSNTHSWYKSASAIWSTACVTGIEDELLQLSNKKLVRVLTPLGQEINTEQAVEGFYIYQYSDGSTKKIAK